MNEKSLKFYITLVLRLLVFIKNIFNSILYFFNLNFQISNFKPCSKRDNSSFIVLVPLLMCSKRRCVVIVLWIFFILFFLCFFGFIIFWRTVIKADISNHIINVLLRLLDILIILSNMNWNVRFELLLLLKQLLLLLLLIDLMYFRLLTWCVCRRCTGWTIIRLKLLFFFSKIQFLEEVVLNGLCLLRFINVFKDISNILSMLNLKLLVLGFVFFHLYLHLLKFILKIKVF